MCGSHSDLYIVRDSNSSWFIQRVVTLTVRWDSNMWVPNYMSHGLYESRTIWDMKYMRHEQYESRTICVTYCMTYYKTWGLCCDMCESQPTQVMDYTSHEPLRHELYESRTKKFTNCMTFARLGVCVVKYTSPDLHESWTVWSRIIWFTNYMRRGLNESRTICVTNYMSPELFASVSQVLQTSSNRLILIAGLNHS